MVILLKFQREKEVTFVLKTYFGNFFAGLFSENAKVAWYCIESHNLVTTQIYYENGPEIEPIPKLYFKNIL